MHCVSDSATVAPANRAAKQEQTRVRIVRSAQRLCLDRGFDGFTMDELAEDAGVSRRTLFNYFPSKVDAVLGIVEVPDFESPELAEAAQEFRAGGPTGVLFDDLTVLAGHFLDSTPIDRDSARGRRRVLTSSPRVLAVVHERFEEVAEQIAGLVLDREGTGFGSTRARLAVSLLVAVFDSAMDDFAHGTDGDDPSLTDLFTEHLGLARALLSS